MKSDLKNGFSIENSKVFHETLKKRFIFASKKSIGKEPRILATLKNTINHLLEKNSTK